MFLLAADLTYHLELIYEDQMNELTTSTLGVERTAPVSNEIGAGFKRVVGSSRRDVPVDSTASEAAGSQKKRRIVTAVPSAWNELRAHLRNSVGEGVAAPSVGMTVQPISSILPWLELYTILLEAYGHDSVCLPSKFSDSKRLREEHRGRSIHRTDESTICNFLQRSGDVYDMLAFLRDRLEITLELDIQSWLVSCLLHLTEVSAKAVLRAV